MIPQSVNSIHGRRRLAHRWALTAVIGALVPPLSAAQSSDAEPAQGTWRYGLSVYGYFPSLSGRSSVPVDANGTPIEISAEKLLDTLKFTLMGSFDAHNGRWGLFTDFIYLDLGGSKQQSRDFTIGGALPPSGTTADLDWNFKGSIWMLAGQYRLHGTPALTIDGLAGLRYFDVRTNSRWSIAGDLGPILPPGRSGSAETKVHATDGIVGFRGRMALGGSGRWSMPFYLDVGAGQSDLTWQAATGISYAYPWGDVSAMWRYLGYEMKSGKSLQDLSLNGLMVGATWRW